MSAAASETWLVLGASSGIARAFARVAAAAGADMVLAGRDAEDLARTASDLSLRFGQRAATMAFDAQDPGMAEALAKRCATLAGPLHAFIAFAVMPDQESAERDPGLLRRLMEVNVTAVATAVCTLVPILAARGGGCIVVVGSVAGDRGRARNFLYGASKAALATLAEGLRARWWREGVTVTLLKPGFVDTAMTWATPTPLPAARPEAVAARALAAARRGRAVVYAPPLWRLIMMVIRAMPTALFNRLRF